MDFRKVNNIIIIFQFKTKVKTRENRSAVRWQLINRPWLVAWADGDGSKGEVQNKFCYILQNKNHKNYLGGARPPWISTSPRLCLVKQSLKLKTWRGMEWKKDIIFINQVRALMIFGFLILFFFILRFLQFSGETTLTVRSIDLAVVVG